MKTLLVLLLSASPAFAIFDGQYSCVATPKGADKSPVTIEFEVKEGKVICQKMADRNYCGEWFRYTPASQEKFWLDGLYDGGYGTDHKGNWVVEADADGCNQGELILYSDSGFTQGLITTSFRCSGEDNSSHAGTVSCTRN